MTGKQRLLAATGIVALLAVIILIVLPAVIRAVASSRLGLGEESDTQQDVRYLGLVKDGRFQPLAPPSSLADNVRLTSMQMQAAQSPESDELDLHPHEGQTIVIQGHDSGGWIYSARVVEVNGPFITTLLRYAFGR